VRIPHNQLEDCLSNPAKWYSSARTDVSHPYKLGYDRALLLSIFQFHKTSANDARQHLSNTITRHNFKDSNRVAAIEDRLESYMAWATSHNIKVAEVQAKVRLDGGFLELRGEISRVDVTPDGYRTVILRDPPPNWERELRMPLLQLAASINYGRPDQEISVGFQRVDGTSLRVRTYNTSQLRAALTKFKRLGGRIRQLSRLKS